MTLEVSLTATEPSFPCTVGDHGRCSGVVATPGRKKNGSYDTRKAVLRPCACRFSLCACRNTTPAEADMMLRNAKRSIEARVAE